MSSEDNNHIKSLKKAGYQGDLDAQIKLGLLYELGEEIQRDLLMAQYWYRKAATQGDLFARTRMSEVGRKQEPIPGGYASVAGDLVRDFFPEVSTKRNTAPSSVLRYPSSPDQDSEPVEASRFDLEEAMGVLVGLDDVKTYLRGLVKQTSAFEKRKKAGHQVDERIRMNLLLLGNPGTGKRAVAQIAARLFHQFGLLESDRVTEAGKADLVSEYTSQTATKTKKILEEAAGGLLLIHDAHRFLPSGNTENAHDREALETLATALGTNAGPRAVCLAGGRQATEALLRRHSDLRMHFSTTLFFPDYSPQELYEICRRRIEKRGFIIQQDAKGPLETLFQSFHTTEDSDLKNVHLSTAVLEDILRNQGFRIADGSYSGDALITIEAGDIPDAQATGVIGFDLEQRLASVIGMKPIKDFIRELQAQLKVESLRKDFGLDIGRGQSLHMVFKGNPGTGKTMMARIIAELFHSMGVLKTHHLVETDRGGLVAGYVGQTAEKTREKIREAMDGILFIDEAYALASDTDSAQGFGYEAIDTLVKDMDDNRARLIVILAGYEDEMEGFLQTNPGLRSRFPTVLTFPDFSIDELMQIATGMFEKNGYRLSENALTTLEAVLSQAMAALHFGNGRYVRNLYERTLRRQALRVFHDDVTDLVRIQTIEEEDLVSASQKPEIPAVDQDV